LPSQQSRARHAAPKDSRPRTALLPGVLLAAAGTAFAGLAAFPASAADIPPRVTAASALQPVELPTSQLANVALNTALEQGLAEANKPKPSPPPAPPRASRERSPDAEPDEEAKAETNDRRFVRPGAGRLTSSYGRRWGRLHAGIDLAAGVGSPIRAVTNATVLSAGWEGGYGRCVRLVHSDGTVTVYAHMSAIQVNKGERVSAGEQIGREGNTGQSTGPHLHFEVRVNGTPVNPVTWLRKRGVAL
jgi:murein DD-endopeptidase MepM/ murein hydrolase activator NlpD